jgi:hypothetical protein
MPFVSLEIDGKVRDRCPVVGGQVIHFRTMPGLQAANRTPDLMTVSNHLDFAKENYDPASGESMKTLISREEANE